MDFIIKKFLLILERDYGFNVNYFEIGDTFVLDILKMPQQLKDIILNLEYPSETGKRVICDKDNTIISIDPIVKYFKISSEHEDGIRIKFNRSNYAVKINKLNNCIKQYFLK